MDPSASDPKFNVQVALVTVTVSGLPFDTLTVSDTGVSAGDAGEAGSKTEVLALGAPPSRSDARKIEGDANAAQAIVDFLAEKRLV